MKKSAIASLAAVFLLAGFFCGWNSQFATAAEINTNASAEIVIGQPDMTSNSVNQGNAQPSANTIALAHGLWSDGQKIIIPDLYNNRVLIYNSIPTGNNASADVVVGQQDFSGSDENQGGSAGANTLYVPYYVHSDGIRLFIADPGNNRILIYNSIPTGNNASADVVVGQQDMVSSGVNQGGSEGANTLAIPQAVYSDGTKLFIGDTGNNRVLIYNSIPTSNNASADVVVGQQDFTSNGDNQGGSAAANTLYYPSSVFAHSGKLFIADDDNNRVLIYNSIPTSNNASADVVVGQQDFSGSDENQGGPAGANTIEDPIGVFSDGTRLIISERGNSRVLIYNSIPTGNNASADVVVGQQDFSGGMANQGGAAGANTLYAPGSACYAAGKLFVGDAVNSRALIFSMDAATTWRKNKSMNFYGGIKGKLKKKTVNFNGKRTDAKKGRVYAYQNGVLKRTVKIKKNGKWKLKVKERQRSTSMLYQFRFYDRSSQLVNISDPFNVYLSSSSRVKSLVKSQPKALEKNANHPSSTGNSSKNFDWPELKF